MSEWITDRRPTKADADLHGYVWVTEDDGQVFHMMWDCVIDEPWMPFKRPDPYVKPHIYTVLPHLDGSGYWRVTRKGFGNVLAQFIPDKESAERIAKIFREVMP